MANERTKMATTVNSTILAIGDKTEEDSAHEKPERNSEVDFKDYFSLLLMGNPRPKHEVDGAYPIEWFGMECVRRENQPNQYRFYCMGAQKTKPGNANPFHFFQTTNANFLMRDVRNTLKEERWISKYVMVGPLKGKHDDGYYGEEMYVRYAVYDALNAERKRHDDVVLPYMLYLHRQQAKYNRRN